MHYEVNVTIKSIVSNNIIKRMQHEQFSIMPGEKPVNLLKFLCKTIHPLTFIYIGADSFSCAFLYCGFYL